MYIDVIATFIWRDEAEAFVHSKHFHRTLCHLVVSPLPMRELNIDNPQTLLLRSPRWISHHKGSVCKTVI
jgi:hypothetical protein